MPADSLKNLLNTSENSDLAEVLKRARKMDGLAEQLVAALPGDFAGSVTAANVRQDGELVVIAASSAWAARLRYEAERLCAAARNAGYEISGLRVRVSHGER